MNDRDRIILIAVAFLVFALLLLWTAIIDVNRHLAAIAAQPTAAPAEVVVYPPNVYVYPDPTEER